VTGCVDSETAISEKCLSKQIKAAYHYGQSRFHDWSEFDSVRDRCHTVCGTSNTLHFDATELGLFCRMSWHKAGNGEKTRSGGQAGQQNGALKRYPKKVVKVKSVHSRGPKKLLGNSLLNITHINAEIHVTLLLNAIGYGN
jgi:hypothetical protein